MSNKFKPGDKVYIVSTIDYDEDMEEIKHSISIQKGTITEDASYSKEFEGYHVKMGNRECPYHYYARFVHKTFEGAKNCALKVQEWHIESLKDEAKHAEKVLSKMREWKEEDVG